MHFVPADFIRNFTEGKLLRHHRSELTPSVEQKSENFIKELVITEVTSNTFHDVVLKNDTVGML